MKTFAVSLDGYPDHGRYVAETPSKARYASFRLWFETFNPRGWTKREAWLWFSRNSRVWREP